ncbi:MAG: helix-turn-helix transcriptional regulator [Chloroflexia bacterium]|nr:helix-turn-helix transcriptional regulator [Chloroflexia bacterium]
MPYDRAMPPAQTPLAAALERVGDRWSLLLIEALLEGPRRFGELSGAVAGIAPNILAERLRRLEGERVIRAVPYSERPPRFTYVLTDEGLELAGVLRLLADWGSRGSAHAEPMRHGLCGTPLEARLWCPTCARSVDEPEADGLRFV